LLISSFLEDKKKQIIKSSTYRSARRSLLKKFQKSIIRNSILILNVLILLVVTAFIVRSASNPTTDNQVIVQDTSDTNINPLSQISSSMIALQIASMTGIYEAVSVSNLADSQSISQNIIPVDNQLVAKPIILATSVKTRLDIIKYVVQAGDTLSSLSQKYGVTSSSISESNNITTGSLTTGTVIYIPPVNGLVYVVKAGDTVQSLATAYNSTASDITTFNDAEISGIQVGERIVIPNGSINTAVISNTYIYASQYSFSFGSSAIYGSNGYDFGWCTWWVAVRRGQAGDPLPSNLGNAYSWYPLAQRAGLATGLTPQAGAVIWFGAAADHVAYVEAVNSDGSLLISEMSAYGYLDRALTRPGGGWDVVDYRIIPADEVGNYRYIY
jgi:surface antigen